MKLRITGKLFEEKLLSAAPRTLLRTSSEMKTFSATTGGSTSSYRRPNYFSPAATTSASTTRLVRPSAATPPIPKILPSAALKEWQEDDLVRVLLSPDLEDAWHRAGVNVAASRQGEELQEGGGEPFRALLHPDTAAATSPAVGSVPSPKITFEDIEDDMLGVFSQARRAPATEKEEAIDAGCFTSGVSSMSSFFESASPLSFPKKAAAARLRGRSSSRSGGLGAPRVSRLLAEKRVGSSKAGGAGAQNVRGPRSLEECTRVF